MQSPVASDRLSFFEPKGYRKNTCGYCKKEAGSRSYYATSTRVLPAHYQELVDRGWRRSGTVYYKQDLPRSCCPHYTMRLDAHSFHTRKEQRRAINRWNRFILGQEYIRKAARLCPQTREEKRLQRGRFDLQASVHAVEYFKVKQPIDPSTKNPIEPAHKFEVSIEPDNFTEEKWDLFLRYQITVHKEPTSRWKRSSFQHFLCTGMSHSGTGANAKDKRMGSYHQCYRLDGKLVAMAVLDLMPHGVSSVYLVYDPDFGQWEFGKLSALREIAMTIEHGYQYYYMGYYIHSCAKMRYKSTYHPQFILDPESLTWDLFDDSFRKKLDTNKYVSLFCELKTTKMNESRSKESGDHNHENNLAVVKAAETEAIQSSTNPNLDELPEARPDEDRDLDSDCEGLECSLFDLKMPGVMTIEELDREVDLDHWLLYDRDMFVEMENLVEWENSNIMDPQTLKGIVGELAAVLGPKVVDESAVILF